MAAKRAAKKAGKELWVGRDDNGYHFFRKKPVPFDPQTVKTKCGHCKRTTVTVTFTEFSHARSGLVAGSESLCSEVEKFLPKNIPLYGYVKLKVSAAE